MTFRMVKCIRVDNLDPVDFVEFYIKANPKAESVQDILLMAARQFKEDFKGQILPTKTCTKKLLEYIKKASEEEAESVITQLVSVGLLEVKRSKGRDVLVIKDEAKYRKFLDEEVKET